MPSLAGAESGQFWPAIDIRNTEDAFLVVAPLPGAKADDVQITVENQTLTIRGEMKAERDEEQGEYVYRERKVGQFSRQIGFPNRVEADSAEATFEDGTLRIRVPKARETQTQRIEIKRATSSSGQRRIRRD